MAEVRTSISGAKTRRPAVGRALIASGCGDSNPVYVCLEGRCPTCWATTAWSWRGPGCVPGGFPRQRRPCRSRTGHLLIEGQVSYLLLQRPMRAPAPDRTENLPGFNRTLYLLSFKGMVDLAGVEPATFGMPYRRATCCATSPCNVRSPRVERGVSWSQTRRVSRLPRPRCDQQPHACDRRGGWPSFMPSTVDLSMLDAAGSSRGLAQG
jgi:hypothetical protein